METQEGYLIFEVVVGSTHGICANSFGKLVGYCRENNLDASLIYDGNNYSLQTIVNVPYGQIKKKDVVFVKIKDLGEKTLEHVQEIQHLISWRDLDGKVLSHNQH